MESIILMCHAALNYHEVTRIFIIVTSKFRKTLNMKNILELSYFASLNTFPK